MNLNILVFAGSFDIFHNYIRNKKGSIKQWNRSLYWIEYNNIIKSYRRIINPFHMKGYNDVSIVFLYGWDWGNRIDKIREISFLLSNTRNKIIENTQYIDPEILYIFNRRKKIKYTKFTRFEIMDI